MGIRNIVMAFLLAAALGAQDRTGTIRGTVTDDTGARVGGAVITAIHAATGQSSSAVTQSDGTYLLLNRELGSYTVTAAKDGFQTGRQEDVVLEIDRTAIVDIQLRVGNRQDSIVVRGESRQIETMPSALTQLVDSRTIQQLPLNGRDYIQLANLQAGAPVARAQTHNVNQGYGIQVSISGSRPYQNSFRLDGLDVSYNGSAPASTNGVTMGVDAVGEFSVLSSAYGAQYGQSAGGIINAVTKSGSNEWRGTAFFFHRNDNLDARNFFDVDRPEFRRHQFGASLGGPVVRNQSFFFVNYEGLRQARGNTTINTTLAPDARLGRLVDGAVNVDLKVAQMLDFYPLPNGEILGDTGLFIFANNTVSDQNFVTTRFDQNLTASTRLFFRYSYDSGMRSEETDFRAGSSANSSRNQSGVLELTQALSPNLVHTGRAGFTHFRILENQTAAHRPGLDNPALEFAPGGGTVGTIFVTGLTVFPGGTGSVASDNNVNRSLQLSDDLTYARGRHIVSAGARLERSFLDTDSRSRQNGDYRFPSIRRFLTNTPDRFRATFPGSDTVREFGQWLHAIYVHDTWRLLPGLTLDAGVRGEAASIPWESQGKVSNLLQLTDPEMTPGNPLFHKRSFYFTPRVGLAWDVLGNGSTLVRAGYGIYFDFIRPIYIVSLGIRNPPFYTRGETRALSAGDFPNLGYARLLASPTVDTSVFRMSPEVNQPYVQQWNLNIEQAINSTSSVRVAYVGSHGLNLSSLSADANVAAPQTLPDGRLFIPPGSPVANSKFNSIANRKFDAHSFYNGLQTSFRRSLVHGLQFQLTYTYSKSIDDSSNYFTSNEAENSANLPFLVSSKFNRGLSGHDIRHYFTGSGTWQLPGKRFRGWGGVWSGWQLGVIVTAASGLPTSVLLGYDAAGTNVHASTPTQIGQRPDAVAGFGNPVSGRPEQWVDPRAFARPQLGYFGNLGRNTITGPNLINSDFSAVKRFPVPQLGGGDASLDLRFEFFNLFNRTNFDLPEKDRMGLFSASSTLEDFSRITSARPGREIQLGLKLHF